MSKKTLSSYFSQNRFEEDSRDIWGKYVLPLNYDKYNLLNYEKSVHITGGRGIGKTMYIQYHCYPTLLSQKKNEITLSELDRIGIYWKPDTELVVDIREEILGIHWDKAFNAYIGLSLFMELSIFLKTFVESKFKDEKIKQEISNLIIPSRFLKFLNLDKDVKFVDFASECDYLRSELIDWLCFPSAEPLFKFKSKDKITFLIKMIRKIKIFENIKFYFFIDEFENLTYEQQKIINTWIKHVDSIAVYHIAYKKHYKCASETVGNEKIQEINDYRVVDIEDNLVGNEDDFTLLSSEIIINKIQLFYKNSFEEISNFNFPDNYLSLRDSIEIRNKIEYKDAIRNIMNKIFPSYSIKKIAEILIEDPVLSKKVFNEIEKALKEKKSTISPESFFDKKKPEETILNAILLRRNKINPRELKKYFETDINHYISWKNNNLVGAIIFFYNKERSNRRCPYYGGFDRFIMQSAMNVRHLLELVHQCFILFEKQHLKSNINNIRISVEEQSDVARIVSTNEFDRKIEYFGKHGKKLKSIIERIGKIFSVIQNNPAQSFAEVNQFAIISSPKDEEINKEDLTKIDILLTELKIWSIIIEKNNTKIFHKTENNSLKEYRLHPILASYFGISPRQKRKNDYTPYDIRSIFLGTEQEYKNLYQKYSLKNFNEDLKLDYKEISLLDLM